MSDSWPPQPQLVLGTWKVGGRLRYHADLKYEKACKMLLIMTNFFSPLLLRAVLIPLLYGVMICFCLETVPAYAKASNAGTGDATGESTWTMLESDSIHRYTFTHHASPDPQKSRGVSIQLHSQVQDAFRFEVRRADTMQKIGDSALLSKQTGQEKDELTQVWVGSSARETIKIYVDVFNESPFSNAYSLEIQGQDISSPNPSVDALSYPILIRTDVPTKQPNRPAKGTNIAQHQFSRSGLRKVKQPNDNATRQDAPGSSPSNTVPIQNDEWIMLQPGEVRWYHFDNDFDQHAEDKQATIVQVEMEVVDTLSFAVMTSRMKIIGMGIPQIKMTGVAGDDSRLIWTSETLISGRYFVEIKNGSQVPVRYNVSLQQEQ